MTRVLLVNMPFAAVDTPSLALGLFKSRLAAEGIACDVQYLNIGFAEMVGWEDYELVLRLSPILAGEQLFARHVFGDRLPADHEYYREVVEAQLASADVPARLERIRSAVPAFLQACLQAVPWAAYDVIGFTSLFEQNLPSLALAALVKRHWPDKIVVFGGANCEDIMGVTLHRCFPFVDFVCAGEADATFPELVKRLAYGHPVAGLRGLVSREGGTTVYPGPAAMVRDLDVLPVPDYDDYFDRLHASPLRQWVRPWLLMETARGCWWGETSHCTFCGLNGLTMKFRTKSVDRSLDEMARLVARYRVPSIRFVDNIMDPSYFKKLLPEWTARGGNADLIFEVKANLRQDQIEALARSRVTVQAGIESLSTHVLKLMGKGSNALMNIQTLKWCKQYGVPVDWNLLYGFPGETADDYRSDLELAEVLTHLVPPTGCGPIRLDRFSPNFNSAREKGFVNVRPMRVFRHLYPFDAQTLGDLVYYFDFDYREPIDDGGHLPRLEAAIRRWKTRRDHLSAERVEGGLVIRDDRPVARWPETMVSGLAAAIYEYCDKARGRRQIVDAMRALGGEPVTEEEISGILDQFVERKLMVCEDDRYLSLAVLTSTPDLERQAQRDDRAASPMAAAAELLAVSSA
jgi:ribosomal peptide maturation radical SAM protein 1